MTKAEITILQRLLGSVTPISGGMTIISQPQPYVDVIDGRYHRAALALEARGLTLVKPNYPREGVFTCFSQPQWHNENDPNYEGPKVKKD